MNVTTVIPTAAKGGRNRARLSLSGELYRPVGMKGWYHAIFRSERSGEERLLTIDQLLQKMNDWQ